jgi:hypothetical protein
MTELDDVIKFENESTSVDFKAKQYGNNEHLLKDLIAMANSNVIGDRNIIVGVKHFSDGTREFGASVKTILLIRQLITN